MAKISKELLEMLGKFLMIEIEGKALDGITYTMLLKGDKRDKEAYDEYMKIRTEVTNCGFGQSEVFRCYEVSNGYIFDMDISVAKKLTFELSKVVAKNNGGATPVADIIGDSPEKRRQDDMVKLAKYIRSQVQEGKKTTEVALFSRNTVPRIVMNGSDKDTGKPTIVKYNAYAIRHWDIENINREMLIPNGIRITKIEPCEILPTKTGVRFVLNMAKV